MSKMMKVEWNTPDQEYHSCVLDEDEAWELYYSLEDEGLPAGIESMSRLECEEYFKKQLEALE